MKPIIVARLAVTAAMSLAMTGQVFAQDDAAPDTAVANDDEVIEQIVVTGSRLKRVQCIDTVSQHRQ